ncbi:vasotab [Stomoxys calcitrans]|uniref:vasotab n=1 Tax=Stomoxys calcitrans TaxID=35570 RepID=UPI0027E3471D|nr:vasotab [Stomoxys calcitrans]
MKLLPIFLALAIFAISFVHSAPAGDSECEFNCDLQDYKPVCGTDDSGDTKTFNNMCIIKTENCLRKTSYQKTGDGDCP